MAPKTVKLFATLMIGWALSPAIFAQKKADSLHTDGVRWADGFPGSSSRERINAAISDCGPYTGQPGNSCLVIVPSSMECGEPNQAPDNVTLLDLRGCAQSQGLRFNLSRSATGQVRSKVLLQDNFTLRASPSPPETSSATLYVHSLPDSADRTKGTVAAINGSINTNSLTGDFLGHLVGIEGEAFAILTKDASLAVRDIRGGTFNTLVGRGIKAKDVTSLYAQSPAISVGGSIDNAYSFRAEAPRGGKNNNLAGWFNGDVKIDTNLAVGESISVGGGAKISKMLLSHSIIDLGTIGGQSCIDREVGVNGAALMGSASASPASSLKDQHLFWSAQVSSVGVVSVRVCNISGSSIIPAAVTWNVAVIQ